MMGEAEIQLTPDGKTFEPCSTCLEVILDAAYSDGFVIEEENEEDPLEIGFEDDGIVETLHSSVYLSSLDQTEFSFDIDDEEDSE